MMKKAMSLFLISLLTLTLTACGNTSTPAGNTAEPAKPEAKIVMRVGAAAVEPAHPAVFMKEFEKALEAKTDKIDVEVYPGNQLGTNVQIITGLQSNTVQGSVFPTSFYAAFVPEYNLLDLPGVFTDPEKFHNMLSDKAGTPKLNAAIESKGMVAGAYLYPHPQITIFDREIKSFSDLKGLKIRVHDSEVKQAEVTAVEAIPTSMSTADVPMALQQKTINGMQSDVIFVNGNKLYQSAKYVTKLPNYENANVFMLSKPFVDSLPADLKTLVLDTVKEVNDKVMIDYVKNMMNKSYEMIKTNGGIIVEVDKALLDQYNAVAEPVGKAYVEKNPDMKSIYDELIDAVSK